MVARIIGLCLTVALLGAHAQEADTGADSAAVAKELATRAFEQYKTLLGEKFRAKVRCAALKSLLERQIAQNSPIPISLDYIYLLNDAGDTSLHVQLPSIPQPLRQQAEAAANQQVQGSEINRVVKQATYDLVHSGLEAFTESTTLQIPKETAEYIDAEVADLGQSLGGGKSVEKIRMRLDREKGVVTLARFTFNDETYLMMQLFYAPVTIPKKGTTIQAQSKVNIKHTLDLSGGPIQLPEKFSVEFSDYKFK